MKSLRNCLPFWDYWLEDNPHIESRDYVLQLISEGIPIGYDGPTFELISDNWKSALEHSADVQKFIDKNIKKGSVVGPLQSLPPGYRASPLGAFKKKSSSKIRVIHDLSWPPGKSINDYISGKDCALVYTTVDHAADLCEFYNEPWLIKIDLEAAFLSCMVRTQDRHLLGFTWKDDRGTTQYYTMAALSFGLRSSPKMFNVIAAALQFIMVARGVPYTITRYLDNFLCVCGTYQDAQDALALMLDTCDRSGFSVQPSKTQGPSRSLDFLGINIDTINKQLKLGPDRLDEIRDEVSDWLQRSECTKRELLSVIGKLSFCSRVIHYGSMFTRRLIQLSKKARNLHYRLKLTNQVKADFKWWHMALKDHNGISWFKSSWDLRSSEVMFTDASNLAAGAIYNSGWTVTEFSGKNRWMIQRPIAWRELYAIVLCLAVFGHQMEYKNITMYTDNQAVQCCVNSGTSKDPELMALLRALYYYVTLHSIRYKAYYVSTHDNGPADSISRLDYSRFKKLCPEMDQDMTPPVLPVIDF